MRPPALARGVRGDRARPGDGRVRRRARPSLDDLQPVVHRALRRRACWAGRTGWSPTRARSTPPIPTCRCREGLLEPSLFREEQWPIGSGADPGRIVFFDLIGDTVWGATGGDAPPAARPRPRPRHRHRPPMTMPIERTSTSSAPSGTSWSSGAPATSSPSTDVRVQPDVDAGLGARPAAAVATRRRPEPWSRRCSPTSTASSCPARHALAVAPLPRLLPRQLVSPAAVLGELAIGRRSASRGCCGRRRRSSHRARDARAATGSSTLLGLPRGVPQRRRPGGGVIQDAASTATFVAVVAAREAATGGDAGRIAAAARLHVGRRPLVGREGPPPRRPRLPTSSGSSTSTPSAGCAPTRLDAAVDDDLAAGLHAVPRRARRSAPPSFLAVDPVAEAGAVARRHGPVAPRRRRHGRGERRRRPRAPAGRDRRARHGPTATASTRTSGSARGMDCDVLYVADRSRLVTAMSVVPEYLRNGASESGEVVDYRERGVALGRRFRSLKLWWVLRAYGTDGLAAMVRRHYDLAAGLGARADAQRGARSRRPVPAEPRLHRPPGTATPPRSGCSTPSTRPARWVTHTRLDGAARHDVLSVRRRRGAAGARRRRVGCHRRRGVTRLDADDLAARAVDATGADDFGEPTWQEGLDRCSTPRRRGAAQRARRHRRRGRDRRLPDEPPAAASRVAPTPTSAAAPIDRRSSSSARPAPARRSSTTCWPRTRPTGRRSAWEVDRPVPPPSTATYDTDPRIDEVRGDLRHGRPGHARLPRVPPAGRAAGPGVRAHHRAATSAA